MQPLDVTCFSPLKRHWEQLLASRENTLGPRECLSKPLLVDLLCSIWREGLSSANAISGFKATGMFPVDRTKYPKERMDPRLLKQYENWVKSGKLKELMEDLATSVKTPTKAAAEQHSTSSSSAAPLPVLVCHLNTQKSTSESQNPQSSTTTTPTSGKPTNNLVTPSGNLVEWSEPTRPTCTCAVCKCLGPPPPKLPGFTWVPHWISGVNPTKPLKNIILNKIKGPLEKKLTNIKRRKVDAQTKVLTDGKYRENLKKMAREDEKKKKEKKLKKELKKQAVVEKKEAKEEKKAVKEKNSKPRKGKKIDFNIDDSTDDEKQVLDESESEEEEEEDQRKHDKEEEKDNGFEKIEDELISFWKEISAKKEKEVINKWYGIIYEVLSCKKKKLFVGIATLRFLADADGPSASLEIDCLELHDR